MKHEHKIDITGTEYWMHENGSYHREGGGPAFITGNGSEAWFENDKLHRINYPAIIRISGNEEWYNNGKFIK